MFYPEKGKKYKTIRRNYVDYRELNRKKQMQKNILIVVLILVILAAVAVTGYFLGLWEYLYNTVVPYYFDI